MSVEYTADYGTRVRFYCTTSERAFGPWLTNFETAERFRVSLGKDPRLFTLAELDAKWAAFQGDAFPLEHPQLCSERHVDQCDCGTVDCETHVVVKSATKEAA